jgi:hypothetical protein
LAVSAANEVAENSAMATAAKRIFFMVSLILGCPTSSDWR